MTARKCRATCNELALDGKLYCGPHHEANKQRQRDYYQQNKDRLKAAALQYVRERPDWHTDRMLAKYGITLDDYNQMLEQQGGVCAICHKPETSRGNHGKVKRLAVDHDHETGKVRALLCNNCNRALGLLKDSTEVLESAIEYLNAHSGLSA